MYGYEQWSYFSVWMALTLASVGVPIPEDIPLLTGGYLCHIGQARLPIMIAVGLIGVLGGDFFLFTMGRRFGHRIVELRLFRRFINPSRLLRAEQMFAHHGIKILFIGRFLPGLRAMLFMAAGVLRVRPLVFIGVNGAAALISVPTLIILGYIFGDSLDTIKKDVRTATHAIALVAFVLCLVLGGILLHRRQARLIKSEGMLDVSHEDLAQMPPPSLDGSGPKASHSHERNSTTSAEKNTKP